VTKVSRLVILGLLLVAVVTNVAVADSLFAPSRVLSGKVTVKPSKWDYFFGRVKSSPHSQARSVQNLKDNRDRM
jgi:hypothetical protein